MYGMVVALRHKGNTKNNIFLCWIRWNIVTVAKMFGEIASIVRNYKCKYWCRTMTGLTLLWHSQLMYGIKIVQCTYNSSPLRSPLNGALTVRAFFRGAVWSGARKCCGHPRYMGQECSQPPHMRPANVAVCIGCLLIRTQWYTCVIFVKHSVWTLNNTFAGTLGA